MIDTRISYIILAGKKQEITPLRIPDNMHHEILRWIHGLPQSVGHYLVGSDLYAGVINWGVAHGLDVNWLFEDSYSEVASEKFKQFYPGLKVFVIAVSSAAEIESVCRALENVDNDGKSVVLCFDLSLQSKLPTAKSRDELIDIIDIYVSTCFPDLYEKKKDPHPISASFDNGMLFNPTVPNTEILHSAAGDFKFALRSYSDMERTEESSEATRNFNSFDRQNKLIEQLRNFDRLEDEFLVANTVFPWMEDQRRAPLIISIPYNSKDVLSVLDAKVPLEFRNIQKSVKMVMSAGQTSNYTHMPHNEAGLDMKTVMGAVTAINVPRSRYLDILGGLHASLRFSPLLRLPAVGSDFNKLLSRVAPVASERLTMPNKRQSLIKTIREIGDGLSRKVLSAEAQKYVSGCPRQVVAITDLPIEWMTVNGVPLGFSHDVCRIPEVPYAIGMQHYVIDRNFMFTIPKDILKKTLVVFGCSDKSFLCFQNDAEKQSAALGYKTIRPADIKELAEEIARFKPILMVFDTHGDYDRTSHESYIWIGKDKLYPDMVAAHHITAPLIFLSACNTAPVYNLTKTIANAFVAEGAFAVTAAYMPLSIKEASVTYLRLLRLLYMASKGCIHKNWLSFVSYLLRTSAIYESFYNDIDNDGVNDETLKIQAELAMESVSFENRHSLYEKMKRGVSAEGKKFSFERHVPNYLMYSTIGRADLIDFEVTRKSLANHTANFS